MSTHVTAMNAPLPRPVALEPAESAKREDWRSVTLASHKTADGLSWGISAMSQLNPPLVAFRFWLTKSTGWRRGTRTAVVSIPTNELRAAIVNGRSVRHLSKAARIGRQDRRSRIDFQFFHRTVLIVLRARTLFGGWHALALLHLTEEEQARLRSMLA